MARKKTIRQTLASGKTYAAVGLELGISRQRVQQLISPREDAIGTGVCSLCGREAVLQRHHSNYMAGRYKALCIPCHRTAHKKVTGKCPQCGKDTYINSKYCSKECQHKASLVKLVCTTCGIEFYRLKSYVANRYRYNRNWTNRTGNYFCSKQCQGFYVSKHYGFAVHPPPRRVSKYKDIIPIVIERMSQGESLYAVTKSMGITSGGSYRVIRDLIYTIGVR